MSSHVRFSESGASIAVVGATGLVGETLLAVLDSREFPVRELRLLASERSAGRTMKFRDREIDVRAAIPEAFDGVDFVFFAATGGLSRKLAPEAVARGAVVIDKSGTWRMDPSVPLVVPEVNADALEDHEGIIACPNCTTIGVVMALEPLRREAGLRSVVATTLQAVSGAGRDGADELAAQQLAVAQGRAPVAEAFSHPIVQNALALCDEIESDGYTAEEIKLARESRKILRLPELAFTATCVRVPVPVGHSASLLIECDRPLTVEDTRNALARFPGVEVVDEPEHGRIPTPRDVAGSDNVVVGRIRKDQGSERLWLWQVADNLRKGAATNAVQIAECLL